MERISAADYREMVGQRNRSDSTKSNKSTQRKSSKGRANWCGTKTEVDGHVFDSKTEARYYTTLKLRERAGEITDLELQPVFRAMVGDEELCHLTADFQFRENGKLRVIDVKSNGTAKDSYWKLRAKAIRLLTGVEIEMVIP